MSAPQNECLRRTRLLADEMLRVADEGDRYREDESCGILYGVLRDAAYRIRALAEREQKNHVHSGKWD